MTIITVSASGALKLPKDILAHLGGAKHLSVRFNATGVSLIPVAIQPAISRKNIPPAKPKA